VIEANKVNVDKIIRSVNGFVSYTLLRTADRGVSVTVCQDKNGADPSVGVARDWLQQNAPDVRANPPSVSESSAILPMM